MAVESAESFGEGLEEKHCLWICALNMPHQLEDLGHRGQLPQPPFPHQQERPKPNLLCAYVYFVFVECLWFETLGTKDMQVRGHGTLPVPWTLHLGVEGRIRRRDSWEEASDKVGTS